MLNKCEELGFWSILLHTVVAENQFHGSLPTNRFPICLLLHPLIYRMKRLLSAVVKEVSPSDVGRFHCM